MNQQQDAGICSNHLSRQNCLQAMTSKEWPFNWNVCHTITSKDSPCLRTLWEEKHSNSSLRRSNRIAKKEKEQLTKQLIIAQKKNHESQEHFLSLLAHASEVKRCLIKRDVLLGSSVFQQPQRLNYGRKHLIYSLKMWKDWQESAQLLLRQDAMQWSILYSSVLLESEKPDGSMIPSE